MGRYEPNTGPRDATWGERHFHVADQDGHELSFARGIVCIRYDALMGRVPMNRMGVSEEIAEAVVWMCSDRASFMNGASHMIDGGSTPRDSSLSETSDRHPRAARSRS
jgi:NAD(P)-dependent dehydrogenase (short-subunit alcohol dehydrogenase family)